MSKARDILTRAADAFDKVAAYFEKEEAQAQEKRAAELKSEYLDPISEALEVQDPVIREKLAATDPDVLKLIKTRTAFSGGAADSLGGSSEKVASAEEDPLLAFCMTED